MKNVSTHLKSAGVATADSPSRHRQPAPRKSTILLLRQFARAYSQVAALPAPLSGLIAN